MKKIENLEDLQHLVGTETVEKCVMEYVMLLVAKAKQADTIVALWEQVETIYKEVDSCPTEEELHQFYDKISEVVKSYHQK
mgnify:CR=1 FL=1